MSTWLPQTLWGHLGQKKNHLPPLAEDADNNHADSWDNVQHAVLKQYHLESPDGQGITYKWVDLCCINQNRGTPEGLREFLIKLETSALTSAALQWCWWYRDCTTMRKASQRGATTTSLT